MDVLEQSEANEVSEHTRAAIGHKGQRDTGHRHQTHRHSNIFKGLEGEPGDDAHTYQSPKGVARSSGDNKGSEEEDHETDQDKT